jgi:hypothetical protein
MKSVVVGKYDLKDENKLLGNICCYDNVDQCNLGVLVKTCLAKLRLWNFDVLRHNISIEIWNLLFIYIFAHFASLFIQSMNLMHNYGPASAVYWRFDGLKPSFDSKVPDCETL